MAVDTLQEISFFALLALINLTADNAPAQALAGELDAIQTIVKQLKNGVYDPKKTACVCLGNIIEHN